MRGDGALTFSQSDVIALGILLLCFAIFVLVRAARLQRRYNRGLEVLVRQSNETLGLLHQQQQEERDMQQQMDHLRNAVEANGQLEESAIQLINGIAQQLRDAAGDPDAVEQLAQQLEAQGAALAAAITANTSAPPAATTPTAEAAGGGGLPTSADDAEAETAPAADGAPI